MCVGTSTTYVYIEPCFYGWIISLKTGGGTYTTVFFGEFLTLIPRLVVEIQTIPYHFWA